MALTVNDILFRQIISPALLVGAARATQVQY
jgi:hypothetical protein